MSNYHFEATIIRRGKGRSVTGAVSYICGRKLRDYRKNRTYYNHRKDVVWQKIFLPDNAPPGELVRIVHEFIEQNFVSCGLCAIAAIHRGQNAEDRLRNNPHVHIIVPTRTVEENGFCRWKDREHDKRKYIGIWRERWAEVQNRAYERCRLDIRVSHESLEVQGKRDREPTIHLSLTDWQKEQRGERTCAGNRKRAIEAHNKECSRKRQLEREYELDIDLSR